MVNCVEVFERIGQCTVGRSSIWRRFQEYGNQLVEAAQAEQSQVSPERIQLAAASSDYAIVKGVSMDGGMVNIRDEG